MAYTLSCSDISEETERSVCQENCQSCKDICDDAMVEKVYNCFGIPGKMVDASGAERRSPTATLATFRNEDPSFTSTADLASGAGDGKTLTATVETVEERRVKEDPENEHGAVNSQILILVALAFVLLIVIVGGGVMICVFFGPRRRNRDRREPEGETLNLKNYLVSMCS